MNTPLRILIFTVLSTGVLAAFSTYLYKRLIRDVTKSVALRRAGIAFLVGALVLAASARALGPLLSGAGFRMAAAALLALMGFMLYAVFFLILFEPIRAWDRRRDQKEGTTRREAFAKIAAAASVTGSVGLSAYGVHTAFAPAEVSEVPIKLPKLPKTLDGFRIVQLSDIHVGALIQAAFLKDLVERVNAQKPDLVCITGDLVDGSVPYLGKYVAELQRLSSRYGTFFVTGNHDYYSGASEWCSALQGLGWNVLRNRRLTIGDAGGSFELVGVNDSIGSQNGSNLEELRAAFDGVSPDAATVLMAHRPSDFTRSAQLGVGLQLSGHTHAGQLFPATLISDLIWRERSHGLSASGDSQLYVSRGCGFVGPPMRVGSAPEIVKLVLTA